MSKASNVGIAIGAGYLLGRKRKWRLALMLAGAAATGRVGSVAKQAMKRGGSIVGSSEALGNLSPELGKLGSAVKGNLADAGKAAVQAAVASRVNQLTDSLHERAEGLRNPVEANDGRDSDEDREADEVEEAEPDGSEESGEPRRRAGGQAGRDAAEGRPRSRARDGARPTSRTARDRTAGDTEKERPGRGRQQRRGDGASSSGRRGRPSAEASRPSSGRKRGK